MQNKGIVKFIALILILVCIFYLSFSFVTRYHENKAAALGEEAGQEYLDSIMNEKVYCGIYSFKQCREMEIGLGLDLKGGMNVILEVSVPDVVDPTWLTCWPTTSRTLPIASRWSRPRRKKRRVRMTLSHCSSSIGNRMVRDVPWLPSLPLSR